MSDTKMTVPTEAERRDQAAQRLSDYVQATVAAAPPLTPEQRDRIVALLRPTAGR